MSNPFDHWRTIALSLFMALVGYSVLVGIPVISSAWVSQLGFTEEQVGRVAGNDLGGLSLGALLCAALIKRIGRRALAFAGVVIAVIANYLCIDNGSYESVLWLRLIAGIGSGLFTGVAVANLGATSKPARSYNMLLFAFAFTQAGELWMLPLLTMNQIYMVFMAGFVLALPFFGFIPRRGEQPQIEHIEATRHPEGRIYRLLDSKITPIVCLVAMIFTYLNIGAYWTYIELAALNANVAEDTINWVLVWGTLLSIVGCLVATLISDRFGLFRPLFGALILMSIAVAGVAFNMSPMALLLSVWGFNFLWIFIDVYQMSMIAQVDRTGAYSSLIPGAQGLGQIIGPNIAASIIGAGYGYSWMFIISASFALVATLIYFALYAKMRAEARIPTLVEVEA